MAVGVIRACREMNISTVAVYSEADRGALHVRMSDEAYAIGPAPSRESYLVAEKIIDAAKRAKADAIHPGYGFLAENAAFARACDEAGLRFIGPPPDVIAAMGSKVEAKRRLQAADVPVLPTIEVSDQLADQVLRKAESLGWPLMIKASA